jgi:DNA invertase Pin-like site-specific DNA recombinase
MQDTKENTRDYEALTELLASNSLITRSLLKQRGLFTDEIIAALFMERDVVTYDEALSIAANQKEKKGIWYRRKKLGRKDFGVYFPCMLLNDLKHYVKILFNRDSYIPIQDSIKRLDCSRRTFYRIMKNEKISSLRGKYISTVDFQKIAEKCNVLTKDEAARELGICRKTLYRIIQQNNIVIENGCIRKMDMEKITEILRMPIGEACERLKVERLYLSNVAQAAGVPLKSRYITQREFRKLETARDKLLAELLYAKVNDHEQRVAQLSGSVLAKAI